jgi:hypothetical protein
MELELQWDAEQRTRDADNSAERLTRIEQMMREHPLHEAETTGASTASSPRDRMQVLRDSIKAAISNRRARSTRKKPM